MPTWFEKLMNNQFVTIGLAIVAFLVALWLVIVIVRMLMGGRLRMPGGRTRQARLGIVDAFDLDRQRQLIIVRRDNTEHLIMIGGPNDLVIESEIVRVDARDFRDIRRDKAADFSAAAGDGRIPAPFAPGAERAANVDEAPPVTAEPMLPMSMPEVVPAEAPAMPPVEPVRVPTPSAQPAPAAQRAPTFPLPPRRPVVPQPERRPVQTPRAPDPAGRTEPLAPSLAPIPPSPRPVEAVPQPLPETAAPSSDAASPPAASFPTADVSIDATRNAARATPPAFLKPLPPRPPIRPLKRITPQPVPAEPVAASNPGERAPDAVPLPPVQAAPVAAPVQAAPIAAPPASLTPSPAPPPVAVAPEPPAPAAATQPDALESLEEEMAKLLGRG